MAATESLTGSEYIAHHLRQLASDSYPDDDQQAVNVAMILYLDIDILSTVHHLRRRQSHLLV